ncbi:hypothetical protein Sjap_023467 [Stephania japonica]|uniref:Uncharacterized protein n=1 Tax=Stephania japonica TaxID=461633 RepID=A0AAP0EDT6_9MAGN
MVKFNQIRILEKLEEVKKTLQTSTQSQNPYELFYNIVKEGHQIYLNNGSLAALDHILAFDIQRPIGDLNEFHIITFNQIRILECLKEIKKSLNIIDQSLTPYELFYQVVRRGHQLYLSIGSLVSLDLVFASDIQRPMKGFKEWRMITFNQIRILEELSGIMNKSLLSNTQSQSFHILHFQVKEGHQIYHGNGSLVGLDQMLAFDIQRPLGDYKEWRMVTFNQIRILEELKEIKQSSHLLIRPSQSSYKRAIKVLALDEVLAFDIQKPAGGFLEWHIVTFNQIRILEELNAIKKSLPAITTIIAEWSKLKEGEHALQEKRDTETKEGVVIDVIKKSESVDVKVGARADAKESTVVVDVIKKSESVVVKEGARADSKQSIVDVIKKTGSDVDVKESDQTDAKEGIVVVNAIKKSESVDVKDGAQADAKVSTVVVDITKKGSSTTSEDVKEGARVDGKESVYWVDVKEGKPGNTTTISTERTEVKEGARVDVKTTERVNIEETVSVNGKVTSVRKWFG